MSFFSTLLLLCFVILPPSAFRHSPLCLQHERCNLLETKTKQSENLMIWDYCCPVKTFSFLCFFAVQQ